jgi:hypothetical protein
MHDTRLGFITQLGTKSTEETWLSEKSVNKSVYMDGGPGRAAKKVVGIEPQVFSSPHSRYRDQKQRISLHLSRRRKTNSYLSPYPLNMTSHKSERRTAVKFSMTVYTIMTASHFESGMDHWINAIAFLNDLNISLNYNFTIIL